MRSAVRRSYRRRNEYGVPNGAVDEWKVKPAQSDNHWFDCLVGCAVAASMDGITLDGTGPRGPQPERRVYYLPRRRGW